MEKLFEEDVSSIHFLHGSEESSRAAGAHTIKLPGLELDFPTPRLGHLFQNIEASARDGALQRSAFFADSFPELPEALRKGADALSSKNTDKSQEQHTIAAKSGYWRRSNASADGAAETWQSYDNAGRARESGIKNGEVLNVEDLGRGGVRLILRDGNTVTERNDGSVLQHNASGQLSQIKYPDGSLRKFEWQGTELKSMTQPDGKISEHLAAADGKYNDQWKLGDGTVWQGKIAVDSKSAECKIVSADWPQSGVSIISHTDGSKDELRNDGSHAVKYSNGDQVEFDKSGHASTLVTADGVKREFGNWILDAGTGKEQPTSIKVTLPKAAQSSEWQFKDNKWQLGADSGLYSFEVNPHNGEYSFRDSDSGDTKKYVPGKYIETNASFGAEQLLRRDYGDKRSSLTDAQGTFAVDTEGGAANKITDHGLERYISRDEKGQVTELRDLQSNTLWKQNDKTEWTASALDAKKPFVKPDAEPGKASLVVDSLGLCAFVAADGGTKKLDMNGKLFELSPAETLRTQLNASDNLQAEGKQRLTESVRLLETREDLNVQEKNRCFSEMERLISSKQLPSSYSQSDREIIAAQSLWHMARPNRQEQGQHPTCNVTTVRSALMHESPGDFARIIADIGTTDKFKTADGSLIEVPQNMVTASGPDLQFPPTGGNRSWISHISDVAMANAFWQRQTTDTYGQAVPKGSLRYLEIDPQYNGDNGERLYRYADGKVSYELRERGQNTLARTPELYPTDILQVMSQITGKAEKGRVIANKSQYPDLGAGVAVVENEAGFEQELKHGPWPKIVAVHTSRDPFWGDSGFGTAGGSGGRTGGWHVVVATGYDAKTGRVAVDNSWQPERDHNGPWRQISSKQLYEATIGQQS